jgi:hypothetical protein
LIQIKEKNLQRRYGATQHESGLARAQTKTAGRRPGGLAEIG